MDKLLQAKTKSQFLRQVNRFLTEDLDELSDGNNSEDIKPTKSRKKCAMDIPTTSDENNGPVKKARKIRTKDEIQKEKIEKEISKIQRELNASKNSKCELYLFCYCSNTLLNLDPQLHNQIKQVFTERKLENQLVFEDMELAKVYWKKKRISAELNGSVVVRKEKFDLQFGFLIAVDGGAFKLMYDSKQYDEFISNTLSDHKFDGDVKMTIAVIGAHNISESKINLLSLSLFEKYNVQLRFCRNTEDFGYLVAQIHRTLAKLEKKLESGDSQLHLNVEKGIREGENLVEDWWSRMLNHMYRLPEECRRAILDVYPTPFTLMEKIDELTPGDAMQHLADIECSNGRRVGPAIAQKIFLMMTSEDGSEIIDRPGLSV